MDAQEYYERNAKLHPAGYEETLSRNSEPAIVADWLKDRSAAGGSILDMGCAGLTLLRHVSRHYSYVAGVDIAYQPSWTETPEIDTRVHDIDREPLPFEDEQFDDVTCLMVLEHVFDPYGALSELRRVMKADGRLFLAVPNIASIRTRLDLVFGKVPVTSSVNSFHEEAWDGNHLHSFTRKSLTWLLLRQGLQPLEWKSSGRLQFLKNLRPSLFGSDLMVLARKIEPVEGSPLLR